MIRLLTLLVAAATASTAAADTPFATFDKAGPEVLNDPHDLAIGPDGRLYVADKFANRIAILDPETLELMGTFAAGQLPGVHDIAFGPDGRVAVAVTGRDGVVVFDGITEPPKPLLSLYAARSEGAVIHSNGKVYAMAGGAGALIAYEGDVPVAQAAGLWGAHDVAEAPDGTLWAADNRGRRLVQYSQDLTELQVLEGPEFGFAGPRYLDVDADGRLVVADQDAHRILMIDPLAPEGARLVGVLGDGEPGKGPGKFDDPEGVAIDGARYYFADSDNNRVVRYVVVLN